MPRVVAAEFLKTATRHDEWPHDALPEIAFAGRSNVGKSSMLNALAGHAKLARVSSTPGRTQALQFFRVLRQEGKAARPRALRLCDLPGYGFAKVPPEERRRWAKMIEEYLRDRERLDAVILIVDARHEPTPQDVEALSFLSSHGRRILVAATKMDKLAKSHRHGARLAVAKGLGVPPDDVVPFSAVEGTGQDELWRRIDLLVAAGVD